MVENIEDRGIRTLIFKYESVREYKAIYGRQKLYSKSKGGYDFGRGVFDKIFSYYI